MMNRCVDIIHLISEEEVIDSTLVQMKARWSEVSFENTPYKITGTEDEVPVLSIPQEEIQKLESDKACIRDMLKSQFPTNELHKEVMSWHEGFLSMSQSYELLLYIQQLWTHHEPLFRSEEMKSEWPEYAIAEFFSQEEAFKKIINNAWEQKSIKTFMLGHGDEIKSDLENLKNQLDVCKKHLNDFVSEKSET